MRNKLVLKGTIIEIIFWKNGDNQLFCEWINRRRESDSIVFISAKWVSKSFLNAKKKLFFELLNAIENETKIENPANSFLFLKYIVNSFFFWWIYDSMIHFIDFELIQKKMKFVGFFNFSPSNPNLKELNHNLIF